MTTDCERTFRVLDRLIRARGEAPYATIRLSSRRADHNVQPDDSARRDDAGGVETIASVTWGDLRRAYIGTAALLMQLHGRYGPNAPIVQDSRDPTGAGVVGDSATDDGTSGAANNAVTNGANAQPVVAIFAETSYAWNVCDLATLAIGGVVVGIYHNDRDSVMRHILESAHPDIVAIADPTILARLQGIDPTWGTTRPVVLMAGETLTADSPNEWVHPLEPILRGEPTTQQYAAVEDAMSRLHEDQVASYIYTSGTTGIPKAAILTQNNLLHAGEVYARHYPLAEADSTLVYLPFSHVFARVMYYAGIHWGIRAHYVRAVEELAAEIKTVEPTVLLVVPRVLEKVRSAIVDRVQKSGALARWLFAWGTSIGRLYHIEGREGWLLRLQLALARRLVLRRVSDRFGRRLRFLGSGGGALPESLARFFLQFGIHIYEGFATTESGGLGIFNYPAKWRIGTVGRAVEDVQVRLEADGELCIKSPSVFSGYLGDSAATDEVLRDGWLYTGDIAEESSDGFIRIVDRKKDLLVTAYGKNVAPSWIEANLIEQASIEDAVVYGDGRKYLVALLVPSSAPGGVGENGESNEDRQARLRAAVDAVNAGLSRHERIRRFALVREFSVDAGTVTPTFKKRRAAIGQVYQEQIEQLYATD